ncbi:MAG TPA: type II and III secretion system protein [Usitatibacter sp.]|nr:type II and III secretion system protein [Usitatibacter sp.]
MRFLASAPCFALLVAIAGCGTRPLVKSEGHIEAPTPPAAASASAIPDVVRSVPTPPAPQAREAEIRYSVVVANQPVREVLLAMARETKINFDIHPGIEGTVNLNAIDQTLKQILTRMSKQVDMRWESDGQTISVMPDSPFLRTYHVDYVNMSREVTETVGISTQVISGGITGAGGAASGTNANNSTLTLNAVARNRFWETLERNVKDLLRETDKLLPEGSSETFVQGRTQSASATSQQRTTVPRASTRTVTTPGGTTSTVTGPGADQANQNSEFVEQKLTFREAAAVIVNPETGVVMVRATSRQHEKVQEFLSKLAASARRQVLIEATVVEVSLNDNYQSGVDWSALGLNGLGYSFTQAFAPPSLSQTTNVLSTSSFTVGYSNPNAASGGSIASTVKLLDTFGKTRVLSTPMLMVLNNQTATLKVVDNRVYFTVRADTTALNQNSTTQTFTTTQNVVPVGFIMNVTPQISEGDLVTISLRPTVTRIIDTVADPNPSLAAAKVTNLIPVTQTREMESVLKLQSGQTAILGGLMMDSFEGKTTGLPIASRIPIFGDLFSQRNDQAIKSELVIFIRGIVIREPSIEGDLASYRRYVPDKDFFQDTRTAIPCFEKELQNLENRARAEDGKPCFTPATTSTPDVPPPKGTP